MFDSDQDTLPGTIIEPYIIPAGIINSAVKVKCRDHGTNVYHKY